MWYRPRDCKPPMLRKVLVSYQNNYEPITSVAIYVAPRSTTTDTFHKFSEKHGYLVEIYDGVEYVVAGWYKIDTFNTKIDYITERVELWSYIPVHTLPVDTKIDRKMDKYFDLLPSLKTQKMYKRTDVINIIKDCINSPKGTVPNSVYDLLPDITF